MTRASFVNAPARVRYMLPQKGFVQLEPRAFKLTTVAVPKSK